MGQDEKVTNELENVETSTYEEEKGNAIAHKDNALQKINALLLKYINNPETVSKSDKLSYWLEDYCRYLDFEDKFNPKYLKSYKRGDVIKVNLGYNIGNEEGGLHYCIVLDRKNSMSSGVITVIPLTSDKGKAPRFADVTLGNEIYVKFNEKFDAIKLSVSKNINDIAKPENEKNVDLLVETMDMFKTAQKIQAELSKMKKESIAMVGQITTISKQRIYDPQKTGDILSGIRISDESLDMINEKMKQLYIK